MLPETFSTADVPELGRARAFQNEMAEKFSVGLAISSSAGSPLRSTMTAYRGRRLQFAALHFSPHSTSAARVGIRNSRLLVTLQKKGTAFASQDGRESAVEAGDIFIINPARPFLIETGEIVTHSIYMEPCTVRGLLPEIDTLTATPIKGDSGPGALFRATIDELFSMAGMINEDSADEICDALPYALVAAFRSVVNNRDVAESRLKMLHKQRIRQFARENLHDPNLDGDMIAKAVNLSARYVYQLFSTEQQTLMKWVWSERLGRCHRDLTCQSLAGRSIGEIAYSWGFSDVAHFSRAFREMFAASPREVRRGKLAAA